MVQKLVPVDKFDRGQIIADVRGDATALTELLANWRNSGDQLLIIINDGVATPADDITVTLKAQPDPNGRPLPGSSANDITETVLGAGGIAYIPFASRDGFNDGALANIEVSAFANISVLLVNQRKG